MTPDDSTVPLLDYIERLLSEMNLRYQQRFTAQETATTAALAAAEKATAKAEIAAEKRFDSVNEFRAAYQDLIAAQMPRAEAEARLAAMDGAIDQLRANATRRDGRGAGLTAGWAYLIGAVGLVAAVLAIASRFA